MAAIGAFEAQNHLLTLLDRVEQGEEITITRDGKPVARLVPSRPDANRQEAHQVAETIRAMSKGKTLGGLKLKDLIEEGRL